MGFLENTGITSEIIPIAGKIIIYTAGCEQNQKKCWKRTGSPPLAGSKNPKPKYLSPISNTKVIATTGVANTCKSDVA